MDNFVESQFPKDLFHLWKQQQHEAISERGSNTDPQVEEQYNQTMLRQNLNAFVCYKQLDDYTMCLKGYGLLDKKGEEYEINTKNKINEVKCRRTHWEYTNCMSSQKNQESVLQNATLHPACQSRQQELLECMSERKDEELKTGVAMCTQPYTRLIRCGLNHIWNEYWRSLTNFGEADEFHLFQMSRNDRKKQQYLEFASNPAAIAKTGNEVEHERRMNASSTVPRWSGPERRDSDG